MPKTMNLITAACFIMAVAMALLFDSTYREMYLTLAVAFGTTAYHLGMRLLVGLFFNIKMKNHADYTKGWYQVHAWEKRLYQFLRVKKWKGKMPVYNPEIFSNNEHTWDEIAQAMCQAELVHETIVILSFVPLTASIWFGSFHVFLITSICGALFDMMFVIMQRYNRPRIINIIMKQR